MNGKDIIVTLCVGLAVWTLFTGQLSGFMKFWAIVLIPSYIIYIVVRARIRRIDKTLRGE